MVCRPCNEEESIDLLVSAGLPTDIIDDLVESADVHGVMPHEFLVKAYTEAIDRVTVRRLFPDPPPKVVDPRAKCAHCLIPLMRHSLEFLQKSFVSVGRGKAV